MSKNKEKDVCEVCNKEIKQNKMVGCHFCGKWICFDCYGTYSKKRKCCNRED